MIKKILITAGPTREMLDPVRFISNLSTGQMGYALAEAARKEKYRVTLISGPTLLPPPRGVRLIPVTSARQMKSFCEREFFKHDALIMTAAVCDFTAARKYSQKIRRQETRQLLLKQTPDIVAGLGRRKGKRVVIGFCLETSDWIRRARAKLRRKNLDGIVANYYRASHNPFGARPITAAFISRDGGERLLRGQSKKKIAQSLLGWMGRLQKVI